MPLRCGGRRSAPTSLRCSLRGAPATTRARVRALRHVAVVAEFRSDPAALRCSAPQRRSTRRPPAPLREPAVQLATALRAATSDSVALVFEWPGAALQGRGRASGEAPLRRRGAQGPGGCASPQGDASSAACSSTEHRQLAQRDAGHAKASSALAPEHRCTEPGRKTVPADCLSPGEGQSACKRFWHARQSARSADCRSEAQPLARPRPCFAPSVVGFR